MSPRETMAAVIAAVVALTLVAATIYGRDHRATSFSDWAVGSRMIGPVLFWFMNAGEMYTTFAVLGISGMAWASGAPAYIAFSSVSVSYALAYLLGPGIWSAGRRAGLVTQADFFSSRYRAPWLGGVVAGVGIVGIVIYIQIQLVALGLVVDIAFGSRVPRDLAVVGAAALMVLFGVFHGLRPAAVAAAIKDVLMLAVVVMLCVPLAHNVGAHSLADVFALARERAPGITVLPGREPGAPTTSWWFMTAALEIGLANWMFPHLFQMFYAVRDPQLIRRNAALQPVYALAYFFIIVLGLGALVAGTTPAGGDLNAALPQFIVARYPPWLAGLFTATCILLALVPGTLLLLAASSIFTRNIAARWTTGESSCAALRVSRLAMVVIAALAAWLSLRQRDSLFEVLLDAYSAIGMLAPGVYLGLAWRRTQAVAVLAGLITGLFILLAPASREWLAAHMTQCVPGLVAMLVNALVVIGLSFAITLRAPELCANAHRVGR
ncbi:putative symporter YodF [Paraburkholderia fynbosensis]|uniref:Putative symporter YodF n=1 Tax=Paraburkholderia fynbosensis TaxID=1200993 RepID=A0A6J5GTT6_9BURK|nr:putative symporter YodF [Paraburkholderia fynbosensis]